METKQRLERNDENHDENNYTHQPIKKPPRSPKSTYFSQQRTIQIWGQTEEEIIRGQTKQ